MSADDRLMTQKEYEEFKARIEEAEFAEHMEYITELLATQTVKIEEQRVYIKVLEQLEADRRHKMAMLEQALMDLEERLMRLK